MQKQSKIIEDIRDFWQLKVRRRITDVVSWIRLRTWDKQHVIKIKTLKPAWWDKDEVLLHAMFQILSNFIELERPDKTVDWTSSEQDAIAWKEIQFLYNWWNKDRPLRESQDPLNDFEYPKLKSVETEIACARGIEWIFKSPEHEKEWHQKCKESHKWEKQCREEETEMMHRLIKIRDFLWT